jgi:hypothetical protein
MAEPLFEKKPERKPPPAAIPDPPKNCGTNGCGKKWHQLGVRVITKTGDVRTGAFSDFGERKGGAYVLRPEFMFDCWLAICVDCMYERLERKNQQQLKVDKSQYSSKSAESI